MIREKVYVTKHWELSLLGGNCSNNQVTQPPAKNAISISAFQKDPFAENSHIIQFYWMLKWKIDAYCHTAILIMSENVIILH